MRGIEDSEKKRYISRQRYRGNKQKGRDNKKKWSKVSRWISCETIHPDRQERRKSTQEAPPPPIILPAEGLRARSV